QPRLRMGNATRPAQAVVTRYVRSDRKLGRLPDSCSAAKTHHSISRFARMSNDGGTSSPSAFAVLMLITNSNFVGCSTGKSPGLAPLKILSIKVASRLTHFGTKVSLPTLQYARSGRTHFHLNEKHPPVRKAASPYTGDKSPCTRGHRRSQTK